MYQLAQQYLLRQLLSTCFSPYLCYIMLILDLFRKSILNIIPLYFKVGKEIKGNSFNILTHHITRRNGVSYEKSRGEKPLVHGKAGVPTYEPRRHFLTV
jgi:hypothetical protein